MDYSKLRGRIKEIYGSEKKLAEEMRINPTTLSRKLNNPNGLKTKDVQIMMEMLQIKPQEIYDYFF